jgi:hypothetical protein
VDLTEEANGYSCQAKSLATGAMLFLRSRVVVAAHGSWEPGPLPTQPVRQPARPTDLLGFKAHFRASALPDGLMPLLAFPGGYGGMVHCDGGRVSLSCCIRRQDLARLRTRADGPAGEAVFGHILESCHGARLALAQAQRDGDWLAAGPIRPGIRVQGMGGLFRVGNAAGEAHPVIAEGISMAMQAAWLLAERLIAWRKAGGKGADLPWVQKDYAAAWRRSFAARIYASEAVAQWAMRPAAVAGLLPVLRCCPLLLTWGARWSGKARHVLAT